MDDSLFFLFLLFSFVFGFILCGVLSGSMYGNCIKEQNNMFCSQNFGVDSAFISLNNNNYCQKINNNGEIMLREIIKVENKWVIKDGPLLTKEGR